MICITEIKTVDVDSELRARVTMECGRPFAPITNSPDAMRPEYAEIKQEHIQGREFVNANGDVVCIGTARDVQDAIGLPFEVFETMSSELDSLRRTILQLRGRSAMYQDRLAWFNNGSFLFRLKAVFKGI